MKLSLAVILALGACSGGSKPPAPAELPPLVPNTPPVDDPASRTPVPPPAPALHGALAGDIDRTADPCTDFFQYSNGAWRVANPIPASMSRWSRRWESGETNKEHLKQLLEELSAKHDAPQGSPEQIVGDFYAACTDEARADAAGVAPLAPLLAELDAIKTQTDVQKAIVRLHAIGITSGFGFGAGQDPHQPARVLANVAPSGLGLPDRDYYLKKEPRFVDARKTYRAHMAKLFALAGRKESAAALDAVVALETAFATATLDNVTQRDPKNHDHPTPFTALGKLAPHVDWAAYLDAFHVPRTDLNVDEPKFLAALDHALTATPGGPT